MSQSISVPLSKLTLWSGNAHKTGVSEGIGEPTVNKRLKLGRLSANILAAFRDGEIDLECALAFTLSDDHDLQERVYAGLARWNRDPQTIRRALAEDEVESSDKRVRFVGVEAYLAAGGVMRRDLFDEDDTGYLTDVALLDRLVSEKLKSVADQVASEGWKWTEASPDIDALALTRFPRLYPDLNLSDDQQAELTALSEEYDALDDFEDNLRESLQAIESRMEKLRSAGESWSADTLAIAGAIVSIAYNGDVTIERGLVRKEDWHDETRESTRDGTAIVAPDFTSGSR